MTSIQVDRELADRMLRSAIKSCAELIFSGETQRVLLALRRGESEVNECVRNNLTAQIAEVLGQIDKTVKAVYTYYPVITAETSHLPELEPSDEDTRINLVVWVKRKSAALSALVDSLEDDLGESQRQLNIMIGDQPCFSLFAGMVDNKDVTHRRGFGAIVESEYIRTNRVWRRLDRHGLPETKFDKEPERITISLPDTFDPDTIPLNRLLEHAAAIERIPPDERGTLTPHLTELKVVIIRRLISDQLAYIDIAKNWFDVIILQDILNRRIGYGRVGGKAAGMLLASCILEKAGTDSLRANVQIPESYFLGSDLIYIFIAMNGLMHWNDQKYKPEDQMYAEYSQIQDEFQQGKLPPEVIAELKGILAKIGNAPLVVRSSSQLEDNFGTSFAGKYDSYFCPNQGTPEQNLKMLTNAIARTYASTLKPEALLYRRIKGLQDYDERMAVLIQVVQGERFADYFFPQAAGVAFSRNLYRWSPQIRREDGFVRLVWGLGTRAVQRIGDDYPRLVALSHPTLQPDDSAEAIRRYSQQNIDLIDLKENTLKTLTIQDVITPSYPILRLICQLEQEGFFVSPRMRVSESDIPKLAVTFHEFLSRTPFASYMSDLLNLLEEHYHGSVDLEFTAQVIDPRAAKPELNISLLQCRPQSYIISLEKLPDIDDISDTQIVLSTQFMVPRGHLPDIRYVIFVSPEEYFALSTEASRQKVGKLISKLNARLDKKSFICIGPGRWGSLNLDLGIFVSYADIDNACALIELAGKGIGPAPEPSLGTHFFQDLMEAQIYPLALSIDHETSRFDHSFFYESPNSLENYIEDIDETLKNCIRLIDINIVRPDHHLEVLMDDEKGEAIIFIAEDH